MTLEAQVPLINIETTHIFYHGILVLTMLQSSLSKYQILCFSKCYKQQADLGLITKLARWLNSCESCDIDGSIALPNNINNSDCKLCSIIQAIYYVKLEEKNPQACPVTECATPPHPSERNNS